MARKKEELFVRVIGTGIDQMFKCVEHDILGYAANTYHKFTFADDTVSFWNDFGISRVIVADSAEKLGV